MAPETRIVIADDHSLIRQAVRQSIESRPGLTVVAEAGDGRTALELIERLRPTIAVLDIGMPILDGFGVVNELKKQEIPTEVILLTAHQEESLFEEAMSLGVKGYVLKDSAVTDILDGIAAVIAGRYYTSPSLTGYLFSRNQRDAGQTISSRLEDLTPTEKRILGLIAEYKTSKQIAEELCVSYYTVETHRRNICEKLDIRGSHALMKFALAKKSAIL